MISPPPTDLSVAVWDGTGWQTVLRRTAQLAAGEPARLTFAARSTGKLRITGHGIEMLQSAELDVYSPAPFCRRPK